MSPTTSRFSTTHRLPTHITCRPAQSTRSAAPTKPTINTTCPTIGAAADAGQLPAVSFLKPPAYQNGHAGYSDPLDEQQFLVETVNHLQKLPQWRDTAVIITYDDSDGWYDHKPSVIVSPSATTEDTLNGPGRCGDSAATPIAYQGRCGYGPRLPLLVVSPYARTNFVDHRLTDQTSILRFIEDNWSTGRVGDHSFDERAGVLSAMFDFTGPTQPTLTLDPHTGTHSRDSISQFSTLPRSADVSQDGPFVRGLKAD